MQPQDEIILALLGELDLLLLLLLDGLQPILGILLLPLALLSFLGLRV